MSMNSAPSGVRTHIGLFGRRNAGKSSLVNALTGQNLAIVSEVKGTTTDPVQKAMELLPLGPVVMIDTPGLDDEGELGQKRVEKSFQVLRKTDIALLVVDAAEGMQAQDRALLSRVKEMNLPYLVVYNKCDEQDRPMEDEAHAICVSAKTGRGVTELKERIAHLTPDDAHKVPLIADLIDPMDYIVLVVPIDKAAPKGRLILPQQQTIRDILEAGAVAVVVQETELKATLASLGKRPRMVVTDSQAFEQVAADTPGDITLTSLSASTASRARAASAMCWRVAMATTCPRPCARTSATRSSAFPTASTARCRPTIFWRSSWKTTSTSLSRWTWWKRTSSRRAASWLLSRCSTAGARSTSLPPAATAVWMRCPMR